MITEAFYVVVMHLRKVLHIRVHISLTVFSVVVHSKCSSRTLRRLRPARSQSTLRRRLKKLQSSTVTSTGSVWKRGELTLTSRHMWVQSGKTDDFTHWDSAGVKNRVLCIIGCGYSGATKFLMCIVFCVFSQIIQVPQGRFKVLAPELTRTGPYPVALIPGQFQEYYKRYITRSDKCFCIQGNNPKLCYLFLSEIWIGS